MSFFAYEDADGRLFIVDSLDKVPVSLRDRARELELSESVLPDLSVSGGVKREMGDVVPFIRDLDVPSVLFGAGATLSVWFVLAVVRRRMRLLFKLALFAAVLAILGGSYVGWIRGAAGLGEGLATPAQLIEDAERAAAGMKDRVERQERVLEQVEESSR